MLYPDCQSMLVYAAPQAVRLAASPGVYHQPWQSNLLCVPFALWWATGPVTTSTTASPQPFLLS